MDNKIREVSVLSAAPGWHTYLYSFPIHDGRIHLENRSLDRTWWWQLRHTNIDGIWALVVQHNDLLVLIHFLLFLVATERHRLIFHRNNNRTLSIRRKDKNCYSTSFLDKFPSWFRPNFKNAIVMT
jgi:hypothetical protein